jgi:hypothetical protein
MVQGETKLVDDFNRIYKSHFPNVRTLAASPFRTTVHVADAKYFTDVIGCFDMMLERLNTMESSGKFEAFFQTYSIDTALITFREQARGDFHFCKAV